MMGSVLEFRASCCICGARMKKHEGNNPAPVHESGFCCDGCNENVVIPARFEAVARNSTP